MRCTTGALDLAGGASASTREPAGVGSPTMSNRSFRPIGNAGVAARRATGLAQHIHGVRRGARGSACTLMKARAPSPAGSAIRARHSSISARLVVLPPARAWAICAMVCMVSLPSRAQMSGPLLRWRVVDGDEAAALISLRHRIERIGLADDLGRIVLGVLRRPIAQPLRALRCSNSCAMLAETPHTAM